MLATLVNTSSNDLYKSITINHTAVIQFYPFYKFTQQQKKLLHDNIIKIDQLNVFTIIRQKFLACNGNT